MASRYSPNLQYLSTEEFKNLVELVRERHGNLLNRIEFSDLMLGLFDDIPGFETIKPANATRIVRQLWSTYHGQKAREV